MNTTIGIAHIKSLWSRKMKEMQGASQKDPLHNQLDYFVLDGLNINIAKATAYLYTDTPDFETFEQWILAQNGGNIPLHTVNKINHAVLDFNTNGQQNYPLKATYLEPVFTPEEIAFWNKNGYIVLKNAIDKNDCKELETAIWDYLGLSPDEPEQWRYAKDSFWLKAFDHPLLQKNRASSKIRKAFEQLWGTDNLFQATDRVSFNPPQEDHIKHYGPNNLHWDISLSQPIPFDLFGMLYLNDIQEQQGAFQCIAGFHKKLDTWLEGLDDDVNPREAILSKIYQNDARKIAADAGDLIICRHELPHGSSLNRCDYPRFVHYIQMYPSNRRINPNWR